MNRNMTKADLVNTASKQAGLTKTATEAIINAIVGKMSDALTQGQTVSLVGFGAFNLSTRQARNGRNPQTKEEMKIPASTVVRFKAGKNLKEAVNA